MASLMTIGYPLLVSKVLRRERRAQVSLARGPRIQEMAESRRALRHESGTNRIAAGRLWQIAKFFKVPIEYLFEGLRS